MFEELGLEAKRWWHSLTLKEQIEELDSQTFCLLSTNEARDIFEVLPPNKRLEFLKDKWCRGIIELGNFELTEDESNHIKLLNL